MAAPDRYGNYPSAPPAPSGNQASYASPYSSPYSQPPPMTGLYGSVQGYGQTSQWGQQPRPQPSSYGLSSPSTPVAYPYSQAPAPYPYPTSYSTSFSSNLFPPGTDPELVRKFQLADRDNDGAINDLELQQLFSTSNQTFSLRTVHLVLHLFSCNNPERIGPIEFVTLWNALQEWKVVFQKFDRDYSGKIDTEELRAALLSLGYAVPNSVLKMLVMKYDRTGQASAMDYDNFVECGLVVKGLTDRFKEKDTNLTGSATLSYEAFMLLVLPFIVA